jgi:hypothetical protein
MRNYHTNNKHNGPENLWKGNKYNVIGNQRRVRLPHCGAEYKSENAGHYHGNNRCHVCPNNVSEGDRC